jgi:hypothetical protein
MLDLKPKYLIFLGGAESAGYAKTGRGVAIWRPELCVGEHRMEEGRGNRRLGAGLAGRRR